MRPTNETLKTLARRTLGLALLLSALAVTAASAGAQIDPYREPINLSSVGVARGQVARLTVMWTRVYPPAPCVPPDPCRTYGPFNTTLALIDARGRVVARQSFALVQGRPASLNFAPSEFGAGGLAPCVMPSLEVFNADTGKTSLFYPGAMIGE